MCSLTAIAVGYFGFKLLFGIIDGIGYRRQIARSMRGERDQTLREWLDSEISMEEGQRRWREAHP